MAKIFIVVESGGENTDYYRVNRKAFFWEDQAELAAAEMRADLIRIRTETDQLIRATEEFSREHHMTQPQLLAFQIQFAKEHNHLEIPGSVVTVNATELVYFEVESLEIG